MIMLATIQNYDARVAAGRVMEDRIFTALAKVLAPRGITIEPATKTEDVHDKIDRWLNNPKKGRYSVQGKWRESGDDLIFEIVKNVRTWEPGRDSICGAQLYFFVDRQGCGWMYQTAPIKDSVSKLLAEAKADLTDRNPCRTKWDGAGYEMKVTTDHAHGNDKLLVFFLPTHFPLLERFPGLLG